MGSAFDQTYQNATPKRVTTGAAAAVSAGSNVLLGMDVYNSTAAVTYLQLFDVAAASVTLGTTVPKRTFVFASNEARHIEFENPIKFTTAIACGSTTDRTGSTTAAMDVEFICSGGVT